MRLKLNRLMNEALSRCDSGFIAVSFDIKRQTMKLGLRRDICEPTDYQAITNRPKFYEFRTEGFLLSNSRSTEGCLSR
jgi:hypothetical protein